jgi:hypothetical protein
MDLNILKVQKFLNNPQSLPFGHRFIALDESEVPAVLVLEQSLARGCLKHHDVAPFDLWGFYQAVARLSDRELPQLNRYFTQGPLLQHGKTHRDTRRDLAPLYRHLEASVGTWAEDLADQTITEHRRNPNGDHPAYRFASDYTDRVFLRLLSVATGIPEKLIPEMPGRVFDLLLRSRNLIAREEELAAFVGTLKEEMAKQSDGLEGGNCDVAGLLTLVVMGHDAMKGALFFGLSQGVMPNVAIEADWTRAVELWFRDISPVGVLPRVVQTDCEIDGSRFRKGQVVYVCPHILHEIAGRSSSDGQALSLAFGAGPHMCPGRALALKAAEAAFKVLAKYGWSSEALPATNWRRDLLLIERTTR